MKKNDRGNVMSFDLFDNLVYVESWPLETSFRGNPSRTDVFNGENGISFGLAMRAYACSASTPVGIIGTRGRECWSKAL